MGSTVIGGITYPENTGQPVVPQDLRQLAEELARTALPRFANSTERDAAFALLGISPSEGMATVRLDADVVEMWNGSAWKITAKYGSAYTDYSSTVAWTTSGVAPSVGNGTLTARWTPVNVGLYYAEVTLLFGSTTSAGTGVWFFSLPFTVAGTGQNRGGGTFAALDAGVAEYGGICKIESATTFRMIGVSNSGPFTWGNTDYLRTGIFFEPA